MDLSKFGPSPRPVNGMKSIAIVAGGIMHKRFLAEIRKSDGVIGVDGGALWLLNQGIVPDVAVGDFDSVTQREKRKIHDQAKKYIEYPGKKDATDLELALEEAIRLHPKEVRMYGVLGRRFDHALAAAHLLQMLSSHNIYGEIVDNFNKMIVVRRQLKLLPDRTYPYISIIPLESYAIVTLEGFAYAVSRAVFRLGGSLGVSNEISGTSATITVHKGLVLVIQSRD